MMEMMILNLKELLCGIQAILFCPGLWRSKFGFWSEDFQCDNIFFWKTPGSAGELIEFDNSGNRIAFPHES